MCKLQALAVVRVRVQAIMWWEFCSWRVWNVTRFPLRKRFCSDERDVRAVPCRFFRHACLYYAYTHRHITRGESPSMSHTHTVKQCVPYCKLENIDSVSVSVCVSVVFVCTTFITLYIEWKFCVYPQIHGCVGEDAIQCNIPCTYTNIEQPMARLCCQYFSPAERDVFVLSHHITISYAHSNLLRLYQIIIKIIDFSCSTRDLSVNSAYARHNYDVFCSMLAWEWHERNERCIIWFLIICIICIAKCCCSVLISFHCWPVPRPLQKPVLRAFRLLTLPADTFHTS